MIGSEGRRTRRMALGHLGRPIIHVGPLFISDRLITAVQGMRSRWRAKPLSAIHGGRRAGEQHRRGPAIVSASLGLAI